MMIVIQLMNSLKFVTQSKGVYLFIKEEETSPTHNLSVPHSKEGDGSREGTWRTSTLSGWQLVCSPPAGSMGCDATRVLFGGGRRRRPSTVGVLQGPDIEGPLRLQRPVAHCSLGQWQRGAPSAGSVVGPRRRPAAHGSFGRPRSRATAARGLNGDRRRGASSAGGSIGTWPLASIDGGCRVRGSGQARVRDANISWAVGFGHGPVAQGPV